MGTDIDKGSSEPLAKDDKDLKSLEADYARLSDEAQRLISERIQLENDLANVCLLYTSPSPRDQRGSRMPSSA